MLPLKYLTSFTFLALLPLGGWLGGGWTFIAAAATPVCLTALDAVLGKDKPPANQENGAISRWLPRIYIALQLWATAWAAAWVTHSSTSLLEATGLALSAGVTTGVFGFVAAHEMIHSRDWRDRALGLSLLGTVFYMHFRIAHVCGHHRRAATFDDPATARLGEGLYAFLARSVAGQFREAWAFEVQRRRVSIGNRMVGYLAIEVSFLVAIALISSRALAFLVAVAVVAVTLLETFNYVAHYGLSRRAGANGRLERLGPHHSWNTARRMNNAALFNMGRHSDHHRHMAHPYARLKPLSGAAELPSGYAAALLTAPIPPLWHRVMDPRAKAVMACPTGRRYRDSSTSPVTPGPCGDEPVASGRDRPDPSFSNDGNLVHSPVMD